MRLRIPWFFIFSALFAATPALSQTPTVTATPAASPSPEPTQTFELGEVIVTAEKPKGDVIEGGALDSMKANSRLGDLLDKQGGLETEGLGGSKNFSNISIRGASSNQTVILLNGQRVNQGFDLGTIPTEDIQKIEVIKGPAALAYGPDAMGGVIDITTRVQGQRGSLGASAGDFGAYQLHGSTGDWKIGSWEGSLGGNWYQTNGYTVNTDEVSWELDHSSHWTLGQDQFSLTANYTQKNGGAPNGDSLSAQDTGQFDTDDREKKEALTATLSDERKIGDWDFRPSFSYNLADIFRLNPIGADNAAGVPPQDQNTYTNYDLLVSGSTHWEGWFNSLSLGAEFRDENVQGTEGWADGNNRSNHVASLFAQGTWNLARSLSLQWNGRLDWYATYSLAAFNPEGTLKYQLETDKDIFLEVGTGFRYPNFDELYHPYIPYITNPPLPVEFGAGETGNPNLSPESSVNFQAGADLNWGPFTLKLDGFMNVFTNLIVPTQDMNTLFWTFENIPQALLTGVETEMDWDFASWGSLNGSYTYIDSRDTQKNELIAARLRRKAQAGITLKFQKGMELNLNGQYVDRNPSIYNGPADSPPLVIASSYTTVNAEFKWEIEKGLKAFLNGTNLLNQTYATVQGLPMPGRYVEMGTTVNF